MQDDEQNEPSTNDQSDDTTEWPNPNEGEIVTKGG